MSDYYIFDNTSLQELLTMFVKLVALSSSGEEPEEYKKHIRFIRGELKKNGVKESALNDLQRYVFKYSAGDIPLDDRKFGKVFLKVMDQFKNYHMMEARKMGKKVKVK